MAILTGSLLVIVSGNPELIDARRANAVDRAHRAR
jgi:hypothetical protein